MHLKIHFLDSTDAMAQKKTYFKLDWLNFDRYPQFALWLKVDQKNNGNAYCSACQKSIVLSNMGKRAIDSHAESVYHKKQVAMIKSKTTCQTKLQFAPISQPSSSSTPELPEIQTALVQQTSMPQFVSKDSVTRAELLWILNMVEHHLSYNSCKNITNIISSMCPDSEIAKELKLSPHKVAYVVSFGLAPFMKMSLVDRIRKSPYFTACFDEALNTVIQRGQMDIWVKFWDDDTSQVSNLLYI